MNDYPVRVSSYFCYLFCTLLWNRWIREMKLNGAKFGLFETVMNWNILYVHCFRINYVLHILTKHTFKGVLQRPLHQLKGKEKQIIDIVISQGVLKYISETCIRELPPNGRYAIIAVTSALKIKGFIASHLCSSYLSWIFHIDHKS